MSNTALLFPGQGSQEAGMGRELAEKWSDSMDLWKAAEKASSLELREIYWDGGDASEMADTRALQPALTVVNLSLWLYLKNALSPMGVAGHSLGEFSALGAASVLSVEDAVELAVVRGKLMAESGGQGQGMAAVLKLDEGAVDDVVAESVKQTGAELKVANYNSPGQIVITGETAGLEAAAALVKEQRGRNIPLPVSGAFHSPLIQEAADEFASALKKKNWNEPSVPVYFNVTGATEGNSDTILDLMCRQMTSSVQWITTMGSMWDAGARRFIELGPKNVLTKLCKPNFKDRDEEWTAESCGSFEGAETLRQA